MKSTTKTQQFARWLTNVSERLSISVKKAILVVFTVGILLYCITLIFGKVVNAQFEKLFFPEQNLTSDLNRIVGKIKIVEDFLDSIQQVEGGKIARDSLLRENEELLDSLEKWKREVDILKNK